jgi:hypothetical protein
MMPRDIYQSGSAFNNMFGTDGTQLTAQRGAGMSMLMQMMAKGNGKSADGNSGAPGGTMPGTDAAAPGNYQGVAFSDAFTPSQAKLPSYAEQMQSSGYDSSVPDRAKRSSY